MQPRSNVTCRLNAKFREAVDRNRFILNDGVLRDPKDGSGWRIRNGNTNCCGIDELDFQGLQEDYDGILLTYSRIHWNELIAKYIQGSCESRDERVLFVGVPVKVGSSSIYNINFYEKLLTTLKEFGFRELCKPYKNRNSGNTITVLAGQMPE